MTFREVIEKIMPEVRAGSERPFVICRGADNKWWFAFTQNEEGESLDCVNNRAGADHFALTICGHDFADGCYPYVHDKMLMKRLYTESETISGDKSARAQSEAILNALEDNIGSLSDEATDYILRHDEPLATLTEIIPFSLISNDPNSFYDKSRVEELVKTLEACASGVK